MRNPPLRLLVVLSVLLAIANLVTGFVLPTSSLPEVETAMAALDADSFAWVEELSGMAQLAIVGAALVFLALSVVGTVGMFFYRRWGRTLSVVATILAYAMVPFTGATIEGAIQGLFYDLSTLAWGGALALAYWSSAAERFRAPASATPDD